MINPERGPREPEEEIPQEKEQTPEEILSALESAAEKGERVNLTVLSLDGQFSSTATVTPWSFEKDILYVETEDGIGMPIELSRIKKVELVEEKEAPEMSPEDFEEMLSQIPALREMLEERKKKLKQTADATEAENLKTEIEELEQEIAAREEIEKESKEE